MDTSPISAATIERRGHDTSTARYDLPPGADHHLLWPCVCGVSLGWDGLIARWRKDRHRNLMP